MLGFKPSLFYFALLRLPRVDKHQKQSNGFKFSLIYFFAQPCTLKIACHSFRLFYLRLT